MSEELVRRESDGRPVRVGLIGAGKFGTMYLAQARTTAGVRVVAVADLEVDRARRAAERAGWAVEQTVAVTSSGEVNDAARRDRLALLDDAAVLIDSELDVVIECTGHVVAGVRHALAAIEAGHHVVMVTVEADVLVGPVLARRARDAGVVYSFAYGDQPALVCELVDWARTCGFDVVAAGKGTRHRPEFHYSTPETVFEHYGEEGVELKRDGVNPRMFNSFLDGTKSAIEMAAVANATGLVPQAVGLAFPPVGVDRLADVLKPIADGGVLEHAGTVEVISSLEPDGRPVPGDLRWGVYVTITAESDYVHRCFGQYGMPTDGSGRFAAVYRRNHLVGLELGWSVARAALANEPTGVSRGLVADVAACAKRPLDAGQQLDGEGGFTVYGRLVPAAESLGRGLLPAGLADGARLTRAVERDEVIAYDDVELDTDEQVLGLRRDLETRTAAGSAGR